MSDWTCTIIEAVEVDGQIIQRPIPFELFVEDSTASGLKTGQQDIARRFMRRWLSGHPYAISVEYTAYGTAPSGKKMQPISISMERTNIE